MRICGLDEVGRGCLAGDVVAAAVVFPPRIQTLLKKGFPQETMKSFFRDSKTLSEKQRKKRSDWICQYCYFGIGKISPLQIDKKGIKWATHNAMKKALQKLPCIPDFLKVDGNDGFSFSFPSEDIIRGDSKVAEIAAASLVAKVFRDEVMKKVAKKYPLYGFEKHKGYGTAFHQTSIKKNGICKLHRKSYEPIKSMFLSS